MSNQSFSRLQPEWYIDEASGSDNNLGTDSAHPLKTFDEFVTRVGLDWEVDIRVNIFVKGDIARISWRNDIADSGDVRIWPVLDSPVFQGTVSKTHSIDEASQTLQRLEDATVLDWNAFKHHLVILNPGSVDSRFLYVEGDERGGVARTTMPFPYWDGTGNGLTWSMISPLRTIEQGTPYAVFKPPVIGTFFGRWSTSQRYTGATGDFQFALGPFRCDDQNHISGNFQVASGYGNSVFFGVNWGIPFFSPSAGNVTLVNNLGAWAYISAGTRMLVAGGIWRGLIVEAGAYAACIANMIVTESSFIISGFVTTQTTGVESIVAFNVTDSSYPFGIKVESGGSFVAVNRVWGFGNLQYGMAVDAAAHCAFGHKPTVTGPKDCRIGGVDKTWAQVPFVNVDNLAAIVQRA